MIAHGHDDPLQFHNGYPKVDASYSVTVLECEQYGLFVFGSQFATIARSEPVSDYVIDDEGQGR
jgi:hypothetical protein